MERAGPPPRQRIDLGEALRLDPAELATSIAVYTAPEYGDREVTFYRTLEADQVREDFYESTLAYLKNLD
jgi:hypothetical protein